MEPSTAVWGAGREGAAAGAAAAGHRAGSSSLHTLLISVGVILSVVGIHALCASRIPLALSVMPHEGNRPRSGGMPLQVSALRSRTRIARVLSLELGWASAVVLSRDQMLKGCRGFADLTPIPSPVWATSGKQDSMFPSDRQAAQRLSLAILCSTQRRRQSIHCSSVPEASRTRTPRSPPVRAQAHRHCRNWPPGCQTKLPSTAVLRLALGSLVL